MKRYGMLGILAMLVLAMLCGCAGTLSADRAGGYEPPPDNVDVGYFYDALAPYGDWFWNDAYGWVWCPTGVPADWRPYTNGEWIWTDDGWTWVADEEWGWAPFHYGRWFDDPTWGWCWVPGQEWGPAWVAWREGAGWIGWAPLPPEVAWRDGVGFEWSDWDHLPGVRHHWWRFCRESDLPGPGVQRRLAPRHRGIIRVRDTRSITHYAFVNAHVVNRSLDLERIRQASGRDIRTYRIDELSAPPVRRARPLTRDAFTVYRPRLREAPADRVPRIVRAGRPAPAPDTAPAPGSPVTLTPPLERSAHDQQRRAAQDLERRQAEERTRLQQEQRQETRQPPPGVDPETLRRQHEEEQRALDEQTARDQRVLEARQQQLREQQRQPAERKAPLTKEREDKKTKPDTKERTEGEARRR